MSLRPRYSLLTLLLLTALIAGGVKLWRGPHHAVMSYPPTAEENQQLERYFRIRRWADELGPTQLEYEYLKTWNGTQWLSVVGRPVNNPCIIIGDPKLPLWAVFNQKASARALQQQIAPEKTIVSWVMPCNSPIDEPQEESARVGLKVQQPQLASPVTEIFLLTKSGHIYRPQTPFVFIHSTPVPLEDINDPYVRSRVADELSKISSSK